MKKYLFSLLVSTLLPTCVGAQTPGWNEIKGELKDALEAKGDLQRGKLAFEPCTGCHRADASGRVSGAYPRLSGQHEKVLIKQIVDIRSGRRNNPKMEPFIGDHVLTAFDIADVASYLQTLPITASNGKGPGSTVAQGKELFNKDCAVCHGSNGEGDNAKFFPMVAAQHYRYLLREVKFIRDGDRRNSNPDMVSVIKNYRTSDLEAVADYMAQLPPPTK